MKYISEEEFNEMRTDGMVMWKWLLENPMKEKEDFHKYMIESSGVDVEDKYLNDCVFCSLFFSDHGNCKNCPMGNCRKESTYFQWTKGVYKEDAEMSFMASRKILLAFVNWKYGNLPKAMRTEK